MGKTLLSAAASVLTRPRREIRRAVFSAIEQQRLAVAAGGRVLRARTAILDQLEQRGLLRLARRGDLRTAQRDDVAPEIALVVDLDGARDHGEISSTWIPSMPESSKLNTSCSAFASHSRRASASAAWASAASMTASCASHSMTVTRKRREGRALMGHRLPRRARPRSAYGPGGACCRSDRSLHRDRRSKAVDRR